jgi:hypothetical protein
MKYLPFENITYKTKLTPHEVMERIQRVVEPERSFQLFRASRARREKPYQGFVYRSSFLATRNIQYRNSFNPTISGTIAQEGDHTIVNVKMRLPLFVSAFMAIWCGGVLFAVVMIVIRSFQENKFHSMMFVPLLMLVFGYGLVTGAFKFESIKSRNYFFKLLELQRD